jgi:hypothetical protein
MKLFTAEASSYCSAVECLEIIKKLKKFLGLLSSLGKKLFTEDFRNAVSFLTKCF